MNRGNSLSRRRFLKSIGITAACITAAHAIECSRSKRSNIIIIMADDMGYSDAGCYGGEIRTPNLDRLAENGLRFTQFYNAARCCPTRASLMTGLYPHQVGMARNGRNLTKNGVTIAEVLKLAGYNTAMTGKWHLSRTAMLENRALHQKWLDHQYDPGKPFAPIETYPAGRGFDKHYGVIWGVIDFFDPFSLVDGVEPVEHVSDDYYFTNAINDRSVEYVRELSKSDRPFFLYIAHSAPHWPLHALPEDIEKYKNIYNEGWEKLRKDRYKRQLEMGLVDEETFKLPPIMDRGQKWDELPDDEKKFQAKKMAVHAAMIDRIDQGIGRLVDALKETKQFENTVIFFLCDNGASPEIPRRPGFDRSSQTRDGRQIRYQNLSDVGSETAYTGIGPAWANAANTPFRYWKKESFEGGVHTPLIVHWPKSLTTRPGSMTNQVGHVMDIMPTCLEIAGAGYPKEYKGNTITAVEGKSLLPILKGEKREGHDVLFFEHMGGRAVRIGDWKLVALNNQPWELYNLVQDRTEMENLAEKHPEKLRELREKWEAWAKRVHVPPPPEPAR